MHKLGISVSLDSQGRLYIMLKTCYRMGFARLAENGIRNIKGKGDSEKLSPLEKIAASSVGGALATWNQPIEVVRVEVRLTTV